MIAFRDQPKSGIVGPVGGALQLKVILEGVTPHVWRRLIVPARSNLGWLHAVIQVSMGWTNSHLHMFRYGTQAISNPGFELAEIEGGKTMGDESEVLLEDLVSDGRHTLIYDYDFGDSWLHEISIERITDASRILKNKAVCLDGARSCPPEDCGGPPGYMDLLSILKKPKHREYKETREWVGDDFDPEEFSAAFVSRCLARLRFPKVTDAALTKVLLTRHGADL